MKLPQLTVASGTIEALKWFALLLMTGDHVNKYLLNDTNDFLFDIGRLAMPLFVFVLAYNLARPNAGEQGVYQRTMKRLTLFGILATPAFIALGGLMAGWWPLNILFTLLAVTAILFLIEQRTVGSYVAGAVIFLIVGSSVEYWWPSVAFGLAVWWYCKQPSWMPLGLAVLTLTALWFVNRNFWALVTLPIIFMAPHIAFRIPRIRWAFYAYYPIHLSAIWLIRIPMSKAGYLFF